MSKTEDAARIDQWADQVGDALQRQGAWSILERLISARDQNPEDLRIRGYVEIVKNRVVQELMSTGPGLDAVPRLTPEFLSDYGRFNLSAQEGYLISLIDGRLSIRKLIRLAPFDSFITIFYLAKLKAQRAVNI